MKKIIPILFIIIVLYSFSNKETIIIPDYAIRFRVIANSNSIEDQTLKNEVKVAVEKELNHLMTNAKNSDDAKEMIKDNLKSIRSTVDKYTKNNFVSFGYNLFPEKEFHGITYPQGNYESLVITLGKGLGDNWWCVMFPPLCLLEAKDNNKEDITYNFYIKEILDKYKS